MTSAARPGSGAAPAARRARRRRAPSIAELVELYEDAERCATAAGLRYVSSDDPGLTRLRRGRGFSYVDVDRVAVTGEVRARIEKLAIPPAWRDVWICIYADGHLLATGTDERGRTQYRYHDDWRTFRDLLNFYRLVDVGPRLPAVRDEIARQLRRRTFDRDQVLAAMLRIVDACGLRIGNETYAEENESYGLTTLTGRHVAVTRGSVHFDFPAKSGKQAVLTLHDRAVARIVERLVTGRARSARLFTVDGKPITSDEVNERLGALAGARVTAKDFRTWHGTRVAFAALRAQVAADDTPAGAELAAIDAASEFLNNTRAVARAHYVHPHVVAAYEDGTFGEILAARRPVRTPGLDSDERRLLSFLSVLLQRHLTDF